MVVQMHGEPGSGKSTLALALGKATGALVLDKDLLASGAIRADVPFAAAGKVAYEGLWLLVPSCLAQGFSVIIDSPCYWPNIEEQGRSIAAAHGAAYKMIECVCDPAEVERRLATRPKLESNPSIRGAGAGRPGMYQPSCDRLILDTRRDVAELAQAAVAYLVDTP